MTSLGALGGVAAVGVAVGFAKAAGAAIEWEDSMAGVRRTVELTDEELANSTQVYGEIEQGLLDVAKTVPISTQELAKMAETAGSLGVATDEITEFARVTSILAEISDDLTPDSTARAFGTLRTTMGLTEDELNNVASAIVKLGISGASTEAEILSMAERASGAFGALEIPIDQLLAWSAAMANVREFSEAGGTTLQRLGLIMQKEVGTGSQQTQDALHELGLAISGTAKGSSKLQAIAAAAGMTEEAFVSLFEGDANAGMAAFIEGLSVMDGAMRNALLRASGFTDIRLTRGLNKIVSAMAVGKEGNLGDALKDAREGMGDEDIFEEMATERFATTAKQLDILGNNIQVFAIKIGKYLLPFINMLVIGMGGLVDVVDKLTSAFPGLTSVIIPVAAALSGLLALKFGARLAASMLPGAMTTALGAQWGAAAGSITSALMAPLRGMGRMLSGVFDGFGGALGGAGTRLGRIFSGGLRLAALAGVGLLLPEIEKGIQELSELNDDLHRSQEDILAKGGQREKTIKETMGLTEAREELARLKKVQEDAWSGQAHGLKLLSDFWVPEASHEMERLISETETYIKALEEQNRTMVRGGKAAGAYYQSLTVPDQVPLGAMVSKNILDMAKAVQVQVPIDLTGIREGFALARKEIAAGFGSVKKALQNPPKLIPIDTRIENTEMRLRKSIRNVKRAVAADDPINVDYWTRASAQAARRVDTMRGTSSITANAVKRTFTKMGIDVNPVWDKMARKAGEKSGEAKNKVVSNAQATATGVVAAFAGKTLFAEGASLIQTLSDGITSMMGTVAQAAADVAAAIAAPFKHGSPPKVGPLRFIDDDGANVVQQISKGMLGQKPLALRTGMEVAGAFRPRWGGGMATGAGKQNHFHIGTLIADDRGIDELDKRMGRRRHMKGRGQMRYKDND
jgi:TP901 family phage tail tape measure protein